MKIITYPKGEMYVSPSDLEFLNSKPFPDCTFGH
jgi:hypothetical protein